MRERLTTWRCLCPARRGGRSVAVGCTPDALQRCVAICERHHHSLFGCTPECKSHRLPQQLRSWPERLGLSPRFEASTLIETLRWTITTRDAQVQVGSILELCPGDHCFQEHVPCP